MARCWKVADAENIQLHRSYRRELKKTLRIIRFSKSVHDKKKVAAAIRRVKTMANALPRDVTRKLPPNRLKVHREELELCRRVINNQSRAP